MVRNEIYNMQIRLVQFKDQKKAKSVHKIRTELFINESTKRPQTKAILNFSEISPII